MSAFKEIAARSIMSVANRIERAQDREKRASPENPSTSLANPASWLVSLLGGEPTKSRQSVTEESALALTTVYAAITLLSETVAQLPLHLYRKNGDKREVVLDHPAARVINKPFPSLTSFRWRELTQGHAAAWGNGYNMIVRNARGPMTLVPLLPDRTSAKMVAGEVVFNTRVNGQEINGIPSSEVLHIPAFGYDGILGKSPIRVHREAIGAGLAAQEFGGSFFGNNASLGGVLQHDKSLSPDARGKLKKSWDELKGGGYQGVAVLEEGLKYEAIGIPPNEAQFIETRKFTRSEIAAIYKIPPHMLGDLEKSSFNNIAEQGIYFLRFTMMSWLIKWEQELNEKLLTDEEQAQGYYFKFGVQGLMRGTQKQRYEAYRIGIHTGFLHRAEVREWEELDPGDGLDEFLLPLNMAPAGEDPDDEEEPEEPPNLDDEDDDERKMELISPFVHRFSEVVESMTSKAWIRMAKVSSDVPDFRSRVTSWLEEDKTADYIRRHLEAIARSLDDDSLVDDFIDWYDSQSRGELEYQLAQVEQFMVLSASSMIEFFEERYNWRFPDED